VKYRCHKVLSGLETTTKLGLCVHRGIDLTAQGILRGSQRIHHIAEAGLSDHHQIHIALRCGVSPGHRTIDKGNGESPLKTSECCAQDIDQPHGLAHKAHQFRVDRTVRIRTIVHLSPLALAEEDTSVCQSPQLALHRAPPNS